ncbi:extracellular solute-binding protein [Longispora sp. K20-0274]|uniref:extracellular solute-binding protein n=1 Tax=Longispora sp. K20-0274 TaxID=3088255 RepID=UPI00399B766E
MQPSRTLDGRIVIDVLLADHPFPHFLDPLRKRAVEFGKAHPEYHVDIRGYQYWEQRQESNLSVGRGSRPDLVDYFFTSTQVARDAVSADGRPLFTSVEKAVGGRSEILGEPVVLGDLATAARSYYSYGGELISLPFSTSTALLYANTALLEAAGVPRLPRTWDELESACRAVTGLAGGPAHGVTWANDGWFFQHAVAEQGGLLTDHDNGRSGRATTVDLSSDAMLSWVDWWRRLHADGLFLHTGPPSDWVGTMTAFLEGSVAFTFNSSVMAEKIVQAGANAGFPVAVGRLPYNGAVPYAGDAIGGDSLWLADGLDEATQDGALAFLQYMLRPEHAAEWHRASGFIPVTGASYDLLDADGWFDVRPHQRVANAQLDAGDGSPAGLGALLGDFAGVEEEMTRAMTDVLEEGADPEKRFARATAGAQRRLDDYNTRT